MEARSVWAMSSARTLARATMITLIASVGMGGVAPAGAIAAPSEERVDHDIYMRESYGLRADRAYVKGLIGSDADVGSNDHGMALTKSEADDLDLYRRANFEIAVGRDLVPFLEKQPNYAGEWIDQAKGGELVVMLTRRNDEVIAKIRNRMPSPSRGVRFEVVESTYRELEEALDLAPSLAESIAPSARYSIGEINIEKNRLDLTYTGMDPSTLKARAPALEAELGVKTRVRSGPMTRQMENCGTGQDTVNSCWTPLRAGVRVRWSTAINPSDPRTGHYCTMGFHILKGGNQEWLTAGHCVKNASSVQMFHARNYHNPGGQTPYHKIGDMKDSLYNPTDKIDAARIGNFFGASEASARIFGTDQPYFTGGASSPIVGSKVWAKGATSIELGFTYGASGKIKSKTATWTSETANPNIVVQGATMGGYESRDGDSGGPIYVKGNFNGQYQYAPVGIINDRVQPEDGEPGRTAFAIVTTVLNKFGASIKTGSN